jgi:hypothetical protein
MQNTEPESNSGEERLGAGRAGEVEEETEDDKELGC